MTFQILKNRINYLKKKSEENLKIIEIVDDEDDFKNF